MEPGEAATDHPLPLLQDPTVSFPFIYFCTTLREFAFQELSVCFSAVFLIGFH